MPTSSLRTLLSQFQSRYPMGCLSSDLLTIHQGQYVVRSVAQLGGTILATGMASAPDIEAAEDRSKIRVLEALGLGLAAGIGANPISAFSDPLAGSSPIPDLSALEDSQPALKPSKLTSTELETDSTLPATSFPVANTPKTNVKPLASQTFGLPSIAPAESPLSASTSLTGAEFADAVEEPEDEAVAASSNISFANSSPEGVLRGKSSSLTGPLSSTSNDIDEMEQFVSKDISKPDRGSFAFDSSDSVDSTLPSATALSNPTSKPEKAGKTSKRKSDSFELPPAPTPSRQPSDRSEEIMKIGIEMKRLGWSTEQGREYLKRTYGKRSRQELDEAELLDFLRYLETQTASMQTPF